MSQENHGRNKYLFDMVSQVHDVNVNNGWFDKDRTMGDDIALLHSEVSEMFEAYRKWGVADMTSDSGVVPKPEGFGPEYLDVDIEDPTNTVVYADPPYENTLKYGKDDFNHKVFWEWAEYLSVSGCLVFVSELSAPSGWEPIWSKSRPVSMNTSDYFQIEERLYEFKRGNRR